MITNEVTFYLAAAALVVLATQLARAVQAMCKLSVARAKLCIEKSIADAEKGVNDNVGIFIPAKSVTQP